MLVNRILPRQFLDFAASESLADGLGLCEFDAHIGEVLHFLPTLHLLLPPTIIISSNRLTLAIPAPCQPAVEKEL